MKSNHGTIVFYIAILFSFITTSLYAEWEDLETGEHDVYGSERE